MQIFKAVFASLFICVQVSIAGPTGSPTADLEPIHRSWNASAPSTIYTPSTSQLKSPNTISGETTSGSGMKNTPEAAAARDMYFMCGGSHCDGECVGYPLSSIKRNTCYHTPTYNTAYIRRASGAGLSYRIFAGSSSCSARLGIPKVNTCYHTPKKRGFNRS